MFVVVEIIVLYGGHINRNVLVPPEQYYFGMATMVKKARPISTELRATPNLAAHKLTAYVMQYFSRVLCDLGGLLVS